jgi:hypothetical protein
MRIPRDVASFEDLLHTEFGSSGQLLMTPFFHTRKKKRGVEHALQSGEMTERTELDFQNNQ